MCVYYIYVFKCNILWYFELALWEILAETPRHTTARYNKQCLYFCYVHMIQYNTATIRSNATQSRLHSYRFRPRRSGTMLMGHDSEFTVSTVYIFGFRRVRRQNIDSGSTGGKKKHTHTHTKRQYNG